MQHERLKQNVQQEPTASELYTTANGQLLSSTITILQKKNKQNKCRNYNEDT